VTDVEHPGVSVVLDVNDLEGTTGFWSTALGYPIQKPITQFMVLRPGSPDFAARDEARGRLPELGARMVQEQYFDRK